MKSSLRLLLLCGACCLLLSAQFARAQESEGGEGVEGDSGEITITGDPTGDSSGDTPADSGETSGGGDPPPRGGPLLGGDGEGEGEGTGDSTGDGTEIPINLPINTDDPDRPPLIMPNPNAGGGGGKPCPCPKIYAPVCGAGGKVYNNDCLAKCAKKKIVFPCAKPGTCAADCKKAAKGCACPKMYKPVCAKSGKVYASPCQSQCVKDKAAFFCGKHNSKTCKALCRRRAAKKPKL